MKILVIDDDDDIRLVAELALAQVGGMNVRTRASGLMGIEAARDDPPDLILLDVMMPGTDGKATLALLRADASVAHVPVVFMTARVHPPEVREYLDLGALAVIAKPFDPMTLADEVRAIFNNR